jgi:hypothetical protein
VRRFKVSKDQSKLRIVARPRQFQLARDVVVAVRASGELGTNAKSVHTLLRQPLRSVQRALQFLVSDGVIREVWKGWYTAVPSTFDLTADLTGRAGFHGLVIRHDRWRETMLRVGCTADWSAQGALPGKRFALDVRQWTGRAVHFQYFPGTDRLMVQMSSTTSPVPWEEGVKFRSWLEGLFDPVPIAGFKVVQLGLNVDNKGVVFRGMKAAALTEFGNWTEQMYQKAHALRHEIHLHKPKEMGEEVSVAQVMEILLEGSPLRRLQKLAETELKVMQEREKLARSAPTSTAQDPTTVDPGSAREQGFG